MLPICISIVLAGLFPSTGWSATATGGTKTTMVLKYYSTGAVWVMRCDPEEIESFQLHVQFDAAEADPDLTFSPDSGVDIRTPFGFLQVVPDGNNGFQVSGAVTDPLLLSEGDVDIFEVRFAASAPVPLDGGPGNEKPLDQIKFTTFATGTDFLVSRDAGVATRFSAAEIGATSRSVTPGVSPMIWDNGAYDDGVTGGPGIWDTITQRFDNLPTIPGQGPQAFSDVAWNNLTNQYDIAAFGGNPGMGIVELAEPISAGGLQFDISGYTLQGAQTLTLSRPPGSVVPTIDTSDNDARVDVFIAGSFEKRGRGTLSLGTLSQELTAITIKAGTAKIDIALNDVDDVALLDFYAAAPPLTALTFVGNGRFDYAPQNQIGFPVGTAIPLGTLTFRAGDGNVRSTWSPGSTTGLTFSSLATSAGATGNFIISGGTNGTDNKIAFNPAPPSNQIISPRLYFDGADFAAYDNGGFVRALNYGVDANAAPVNILINGTDAKLTTTPPAQNVVLLRTLNLSGNGTNFPLNPGQTLTLTGGGLLKSGGGSSALSGGSGLTTGGPGVPAELIFRTDTASDSLTINTPILGTSTRGLTKSGAGTLTLIATNSYTGPTTVNDGRLIVNGLTETTPIALHADATLGGQGKVGPLAGAGTVSPGVGTGASILTAQSLDPAQEMDFHFHVSQPAPNYANAGASGNDILRLTSAAPLATGLCAPNRIHFDFQMPVLPNGATFIGGFFTDGAADYTQLLKSAAVVCTLNGGPVPAGIGVVFDKMVPQTANFGTGIVMGRAMRVRVIDFFAFQDWQNANFAGGASDPNAQPGADPDHDGVVNIVEFVVGSNPNAPGEHPGVLSAVSMGGTPFLRFSLPRNPLATSAFLAIETTPELAPATWSTQGVSIEVETPTLLQVLLPIDGPQRFLRAKVVQP